MTIEQKFNILAAYVMAEDSHSRENARNALESVMGRKDSEETFVDTESVVHRFLAEIGAQPHLKGYRYVVYGIQKAMSNPDILEEITKGFYPLIASEFDTTASKVERAIRHMIESTWDNGNLDALVHYFGYSVRTDKGKPVNSHFIARSAIIINEKMKGK